MRLLPLNVNDTLLNAKHTIANTLPEPESMVKLPMLLKRFDLLLLPVAPSTLVWTRMLLRAQPLPCPCHALTHNVHPSACMDLILLGLHDFSHTQEDMAFIQKRLLRTVWQYRNQIAMPSLESPPFTPTAPRKSPLRKKRVSIPCPINPPLSGIDQQEGFNAAKRRIVAEFERNYLHEALSKSQGNIGMAARRSLKNRRAFWELMRKHDICADAFREEQ